MNTPSSANGQCLPSSTRPSAGPFWESCKEPQQGERVPGFRLLSGRKGSSLGLPRAFVWLSATNCGVNFQPYSPDGSACLGFSPLHFLPFCPQIFALCSQAT
ncbi:hypothetical protein BaRGS_00032091 [Batillaria attramentaria]|uniref:Uncharacterized protein n=1 Tax=Batillaria attramentaria TaxID=370345 RepID=A0ABD0JNP9_9CAEN